MKKLILNCSVAIAILFLGTLPAQNNCAIQGNSESFNNHRITSYPAACSNVTNYIPTGSTDTITYRINYHFFRHTNGAPSGNEFVTLQDCKNSVWGLNHQVQTLTAPTLPTTPPQPVIQDMRIRFQFTNMYIHYDEAAFYGPAVCTSYFYNNYAVNPQTEINVFFVDSTISGGSACGPAYNYVNHGFYTRDWVNTAAWPWGPTGLLIHELGHAIGNLNHTNYCPGQFPDYTCEVGYPWGWVGCIQDSSSNNIMGYNKCRTYLSPQQIGNFHMGVNYQHTGSHGWVNTAALTTVCDYTASKTVSVTSTQTWTTGRAINGDLIVKAGNKLTIQCVVSLPPGGRVIVEPTAKLIIDGGKLTTYCTNMWEGVQVWGNSTANQAINGTTGMPTYQGMLSIINGGTIEKAAYGVSTIKVDVSGSNIDWTKTGGIVQAVGANFINNNKDVAFWPYSPYSSVSYFRGCTFQLGTRAWSGWADSRVSLYGLKGVKFYGNTFTNTSTYLGEGIKSVDAVYNVLDNGTVQNSFSGFNYGIYVANSVSSNAAHITHATFTNNQIGCIYMSNANYCTIETCSFNVNSTSSVMTPDYGVYLDNCTGYNFLNNTFTGASNGYLHEGAYINNSGAYANAAYNNTFTNLNYGLWAALINKNNTDGTGLLMNCNDFTNCGFNIGVQGSGSTHGVANVQGVHNDPANYVRNTYGSPSCGAGNKFYVSNANTTITHTSFTGSTYHPIPQPSCGSSVLTIYQDAGTYSKSTYCPANPNPPCGSGCRMSEITQEIKYYKNKVSALSDSSEKNQAQEKLTYYKNLYGLLQNEQIRKLISDSTISNPTDSVIAVLKTEHSAETYKLLVSSYISKNDYANALLYMDSIKTLTGEYNDFCHFHNLLIDLKKNTAYPFHSDRDDIKDQLLVYANDYTNDMSAAARAVLMQNFGITIRETILLPNSMGADPDNATKNQDAVSLFEVYPNPAQNSIIIDVKEQFNENTTIRICDVSGRILKSVHCEGNDSSVNISDIPNGVYFVTLIRNNQTIGNKKIVIIK